MPNRNYSRVSEDVKRELSAILRELKDPRIPEMASVTKINLTPDYKYCKIYVSLFTDDEGIKKDAVNALTNAAGHMRRELGRRVDLRFIPQLSFEADDSIAYGARMSKIINELDIEK